MGSAKCTPTGLERPGTSPVDERDITWRPSIPINQRLHVRDGVLVANVLWLVMLIPVHADQ